MAETPQRPDSLWQRAIGGDRDAFEEAIEPHRDALIRAAQTAVHARRSDGVLNDDAITPEELVGETLLRAFDGRERYHPGRMGLRAWLLALQHRALNRITADERGYHDRKAISLSDEIPTNERYDAVEESFYEFNDPFDVTTYDEVIPSQTPMDVELDPSERLSEDELERLEAADISPSHRQIIELHDEFELSLSEVAQILEQSLQDVAEQVNSARVHVRQMVGSADLPDRARDDVDSYTGERIERNPDYGTERGPTADEPSEGRLARAARDATPGRAPADE